MSDDSPRLLARLLEHYEASQRPPVMTLGGPIVLIGDGQPMASPTGSRTVAQWRKRHATPKGPSHDHPDD